MPPRRRLALDLSTRSQTSPALPGSVAHAFNSLGRYQNRQAQPRTSGLPIDQQTYLQSNAIYYQQLPNRGWVMSVRKKIVKSITPEGEPIETLWWIADYTDGSGLRHQRRFKHKREASALHDAIRAGTDRSYYSRSRSGNLPARRVSLIWRSQLRPVRFSITRTCSKAWSR